MTLSTLPRDRGFTAGLYGRKRTGYPHSYTETQIREFLAGWAEGNDEARLRRAEAKRVAKVGYHEGMVAVKSKGNGKVYYLTHEQYNRMMKRYGSKT